MDRALEQTKRIPVAFRRRGDAATVSATERRVLEVIRRSGVTSRADLTRATDLAPQSISRLVEALEARGLVQFGGRRNIGRGHPSLSVSLTPSAAYGVGVSVTTDQAALALIAFDGAVIAERTLDLPGMIVAEVVAAVQAEVEQLFAEHQLDRRRLFGLGLAMSGFFTSEGGVNPPDPLAHWSDADIAETFMRAFDRPVWVENDGSASAIGESLYGVGLKHATFAYLYFTYGFGGGLVLDGKLTRGRFGNAGEFSAMLPASRHADRPTLELLRRMLAEHGVELASIAELTARFDPEWPGVDAWIERVRGPLSDIVSAISAVADPAAIVFGGQAPKPLAQRLIAAVEFYNRARRGERRPTPELLVSPISGNTAAIGAASMPFKYAFFE